MKEPRMRSLDEALSELEREHQVRQRCYPRWIADGKLTRVDAEDRRDRLMTAMEALQKLSGLQDSVPVSSGASGGTTAPVSTTAQLEEAKP